MELTRTIFYVWIRWISVTIAALGFGFDLAGASVLTWSSNNWGIVGIGAFGMFFVLTLVKEVDVALQQKPNITVSPEVHGDRATLVVTNTGGAANFTARARVRATIPEPALYNMYWESVRGTSCHIDGGGGAGSILVAGRAKLNQIDKIAIDQDSDVSTSFLRGDLILFRMGTGGVASFPAFSGETSKEIKDGREIISGTSKERCIVEITITATPALKKKWGTRKYLCEIENRQIKLYETELSTPHKYMNKGKEY